MFIFMAISIAEWAPEIPQWFLSSISAAAVDTAVITIGANSPNPPSFYGWELWEYTAAMISPQLDHILHIIWFYVSFVRRVLHILLFPEQGQPIGKNKHVSRKGLLLSGRIVDPDVDGCT
jgi:hypothetical protein